MNCMKTQPCNCRLEALQRTPGPQLQLISAEGCLPKHNIHTLCCGARLGVKQRSPRTFTYFMLQEKAWKPCRLAGLETQALALLAGVTLQELYCVGTSTPMEVVQVNLKSCSIIFPEYQALGHVRLAGFDCLLCTGESMNLKRPGLSCSGHGVHSFRAASPELQILKAPLALGSPLFLYQK